MSNFFCCNECGCVQGCYELYMLSILLVIIIAFGVLYVFLSKMSDNSDQEAGDV